MKLQVIELHEGYGTFPLFPKGSAVSDFRPSGESPHWFACVIGGQETYVPEVCVAAGRLTRDYNPTELVVQKGQVVTLLAVVYEWLYVEDAHGKTGWLPASKVVSV